MCLSIQVDVLWSLKKYGRSDVGLHIHYVMVTKPRDNFFIYLHFNYSIYFIPACSQSDLVVQLLESRVIKTRAVLGTLLVTAKISLLHARADPAEILKGAKLA